MSEGVGRPPVDHIRGLPDNIGIGGRNLNSHDRAVYQSVYPLLRQYIAARNVPWLIDASDTFDTNDPTYIDYCHVSAIGNQAIAVRIDTALAALGATEPGASNTASVPIDVLGNH